MKFTIPGVWDQHLRHDTDLLREEPSLGAAFAARRSVRAGFGYRVYIDLTPEDARQLADHIEGQCELEMQIAGGGGRWGQHFTHSHRPRRGRESSERMNADRGASCKPPTRSADPSYIRPRKSPRRKDEGSFAQRKETERESSHSASSRPAAT